MLFCSTQPYIFALALLVSSCLLYGCMLFLAKGVSICRDNMEWEESRPVFFAVCGYRCHS